MNSDASPAFDGNVQMAKEVPAGSAATGIKLGVVLFVRANTTCRLRRSDSVCAKRNPVCSESLTVRILLFLIQTLIVGIARATMMAKTDKVTMASIMVKPAAEFVCRVSIGSASAGFRDPGGSAAFE